MTKSYKYGEKETPKNKSVTKKTESVKTNNIDLDEQSYIQHMNKRMNDKIDDIYFNSLEKIGKMHSMIVEGVMRKHRQLEQDNEELSEKERDRLWKIRMGKF